MPMSTLLKDANEHTSHDTCFAPSIGRANLALRHLRFAQTSLYATSVSCKPSLFLCFFDFADLKLSRLQHLHDQVDPDHQGIEKQYSAPRTPQQNGVAERRNRTLIEAARSLLADSKLLFTFWAEVVNTACFVQNRVLVSKAYRVFNSSSRIIEESDNVKCNENTPNQIGTGPDWLFDIDSLTNALGFSNVQNAGTSSEKVQAQSSEFVLFQIPTADPVEFCQQEKKDDSESEDSDPDQDEDSKADEEDKGDE
ncbi:hypothetical protein L6452_44771 [Arctium lappa]|nr:hypothetical protein L6452_44771 [Arctium lappa]